MLRKFIDLQRNQKQPPLPRHTRSSRVFIQSLLVIQFCSQSQ
jgi:hypothetical protein